jgi:predicted dehydrogenase
LREIGVGIVGLGGIAKIHLIAMNSMNLIFDNLSVKPKIVGICTRKGKTDLGLFDFETDNLHELLSSKSIDMIDICTPNFLHFEQGKETILARKNIYMEKPISNNINEARKLVNICKEKEVVNQVAFMYRFMPAVVLARDYIKAGKLGDILNFRATLFHKGYLNSERPMSWRLDKKMSGGGALMDLGIHMADLIRFLLGEVKEVRGKTSTYFKERYKDSTRNEMVKVDVDEWALLDITLENGAYGTLEVSRISSDLREETVFEVYGTRGKVKITTVSPDFPEIFIHEKGRLLIGDIKRISEFSKYHKNIYPGSKFDMGWFINSHLASILNFMLNIKEGYIKYMETPTLEEAYKSQKIIEMGYISASEGNRVVTIDEIS